MRTTQLQTCKYEQALREVQQTLKGHVTKSGCQAIACTKTVLPDKFFFTLGSLRFAKCTNRICPVLTRNAEQEGSQPP